MSPWFILLLVLFILVVLLVIIGIGLCLHLTINDNFEAQPCALVVIAYEHPSATTAQLPAEEAKEGPKRPLMSEMIPINPIEVAKTAGKVWSFVESK